MRIFSELEKNIINDINNGSVTDVYSFMKKYCKYENKHEKMNGSVNISNNPMINLKYSNEEINMYIYDYDDAANKVVSFINLINNLKDKGYINLINQKIQEVLGFIKELGIENKRGGVEFPLELFKIFYDVHLQTIAKNELLTGFIENNYMSVEEKQLYDETKNRKTSQNWTIGIAAISIFVNIVLAGIHILTYTTERQVIIKNSNEFKNTVILELNREDQQILLNMIKDKRLKIKRK